jgi:hypothetical protein
VVKPISPASSSQLRLSQILKQPYIREKSGQVIRRAMVRQYGAVAGNWATNVMLARDKDAIRQTTLEEDLEELFNFLKTRRGARRASEAYA